MKEDKYLRIGMNVCWPDDIELGINKEVACAIKDIETSIADGYYYDNRENLKMTGICHGSLFSIIKEIRRLHKND